MPVLDAILTQDPTARVAAETLCNTGLVVLAVKSPPPRKCGPHPKVARDTIKHIGYDNTDYGIDCKGCAVLVAYDKQSPDIAQGVDRASDDYLNQVQEIGASCLVTPVMRHPHSCPCPSTSHPSGGTSNHAPAKMVVCLGCAQTPSLKSHCVMSTINRIVLIPWCYLPTRTEMSDGDRMKPEFTQAVIEIIQPVLPKELIKGDIKYLVNPTGRFVVGGPQEIVVSLAGKSLSIPTAVPHRMGAGFPRQRSFKVDRSAAYAGRYVAKTLWLLD